MKIRPLGDRILVKAEEPKEKKIGGIIIPDTAKEKPQEGTVIAAGNGKIGKTVKLFLWKLKLAIKFYMENIPEQKLK